MSNQLLLHQARTILRHCLQLKDSEDLLIVWDETIDPALVSAIRATASEFGSLSYLLTYEPLFYHPLKEYCLFAGASLRQDSIRIPKVLEMAIQAIDAVVLLTSDMELLFAPGWGDFLADRNSKNGKRIVFIPYMDIEKSLRLLPRSAEEVSSIQKIVESGASAFRQARHAHVTSDAGTDLYLKLGQYETRLHTGVAKPGSLQLLPAGQVTRVPDDESAHGTLIIDRSIAANDYRELIEPIVLRVEKGNITNIEGGREARSLKHFLASLNDPNVYHLTELGIGTNARCKVSGEAAPAEDTHALGTVSLALACDVHIGGRVPAPVHIDMTMYFPTLELDGKIIASDGQLFLD